MQTFAYVALDSGGARRTGMIDADNSEAAVAQLAAEGRFVLDVRESAKASGTKSSSGGGFSRPSPQDLALFTRRLADLYSAGLPIDRVLHVIAEQSENHTLKLIAEEALNDVRTGLSVSQALAKYPKYFSDVYTLTLRAGEASGQFGDVAGRLADFEEKSVTRRSQIISALIYPAVLCCVAVGVMIFIMAFAVPQLSGVFKDMGNDLPVTTKMLLAGGQFLSSNGLEILAGVVALFVGARVWGATSAGKDMRDSLLINLPVIGPVIRKATVSRFARVLATLVFGGVPTLQALEIAGLSAGNRIFLKSAQVVEEEVRAGRTISEAMRDAGEFPPVLTHMVAVGEETGDLSKMLGRVSDSMDFEVDTAMRRLVSMVEPAIVLVMGSFVGFVVLSVILPIYQSQELVK